VGEPGHKAVEIIVGLGHEREHFAGADIEGDGGAGAAFHRRLGGLLQVDVEAGDDAFALHGQALLNRQIHLVARRVHEIDGTAGLALQLVVKYFFQAGAAGGTLHLEGQQVLARKILHLGVVVHAGVAQRLGGGVVVGVVAAAGGINLQGRADREALEQPGVFLGREVVEQHVGQEQGLVDVAVEVGGADALAAVEDEVDLVEVALGHGGAGDALQLVAVGPLRRRELAVVGADGLVFGAEFGADRRLGEVEHDGEAGAVVDQHVALPVEQPAARPRHDDAALILQALALAVEAGLEELAMRHAADQHEEQAGDEAVKKKQPRVAGAVGFDRATHGDKLLQDTFRSTAKGAKIREARQPAGSTGKTRVGNSCIWFGLRATSRPSRFIPG
jgi:hypothetical protein